MTFKESMDYINNITKKGSILGLDTTRELLRRLGNPQDRLKFVHIAGTNGKGSVLAYTSSILTSAGYRTGRYISPIITDYCEKVQVDGKFITHEAVARIMTIIKETCDAMVEDGYAHPTAFEIETAMAFIYFLNEKCDIVVLECGMGGRDDSTNVINTAVCEIITSVSLDHVGILGNTVEEIAECKAGIIKEKSKVVCYSQEDNVMNVIKQAAHKMNSEVIVTDYKKVIRYEDSLSGQLFDYGELKNIKITLLGLHQIKNALCAIEAAYVLREKGFNISDEHIRQGLKNTRWHARFSVISQSPLMIADGAHNPDGAYMLANAVERYLDGYTKIFVMGVLKDKDYRSIIQLTNKQASAIITINPDNARALSDVELKEAIDEVTGGNIKVIAGGRIENGIELTKQMVKQFGEEKCAIIICGSLSFMGDLYRYMGEV